MHKDSQKLNNKAAELLEYDRLRRGAWGWVDRLQRKPDGSIRIQGWAGSLDQVRLDADEVYVDGNSTRIGPDIARPDVAAALEATVPERSGFDFNAAISGPGFVEASAICQNNGRALRYAGRMDNRGATSNE